MKKFIFVLLILSLITLPLSSCKKEEKIEQPIIANEIALKSESEFSTIGIYLPTVDYLRVDEQHLSTWENDLSTLSNFIFDITYMDAEIDEKTVMPFSQGLDKLVYVSSMTMLDELIKQELVIPLNSYLDEIEESENIDQAYYEPYTDADGNIYALPAYRFVEYLGYRTYNANWLKEIGVPAPNTLDEYTKLAIKIRESNVGTNNREAYIGEIDNYHYFTHEFIDVFLSFGCKPSFIQSQNISYNDEKREYEDIVLTQAFEEALTYIKYLEDNDLIIYTEGMKEDEKENKYDIGWTMGDPIEVGLYLEGEATEQLISEVVIQGGFAVLKDCENVSEQLSFLINRVFLDEDLLEALNYGIRGYNFEENDGYYYLISNDDGSWRVYPAMSINIFNEPYNTKPLYRSQEEYLNNQENYDLLQEKGLEFIESITLIKANQPQIIFEHNFNKELPIDLNDMTNAINKSFRKLLQAVFRNEKTIDEAITIYTNEYYTDGYKEYFAELNGY